MKNLKFLLLILMSCNSPMQKKPQPLAGEVETNIFYQYNTWAAFVNKVFEGDATVRDLRTHGNIALGSFDLLDGELIMVDGITYKIREDASIQISKEEDKIVYANATFFRPDTIFTVSKSLNLDSLRIFLNEHLPTRNNFYSFKIYGEFDYLKCGGLTKQTVPFTKGLDVLIPNRPVFEGNHMKGTIIGFYCPEMIGNINVVGYHFHFISDNKKLGGHLMEFSSVLPLKIEMAGIINYEFQLPKTKAFEKAQLEKEFQYKKK